MGYDKLREKIDEVARPFDRECACPCNCKIRHRFGEICSLCRSEDHWVSLNDYLKKIEERISQ